MMKIKLLITIGLLFLRCPPFRGVTEWLFGGSWETGAWRNALANTLVNPRCCYVCVFNWESIRNNDTVLDAVRALVAEGVK